MIDAKRLLEDLKKLRKKLEADLRSYHSASVGRALLEAEWQQARDTKRTADTFETFFGAALDQAAVHWILALVFLRFLEDNCLLDRPVIAGPGERLEIAQLRQREWFRTRPEDSDAEYLLANFAEVANYPGLAGLFDPTHNPLFRLPVSGDGAIALFDFFRNRSAETGELVHEFTEPDWNTRFLGDLYQDLSEEARKRYALLQTPEFVEEWILSRTLEPAIREFGYAQVRMIDPTCGSGHFLLGAFARLLEEWQRHAPDMPPAAQAQRALDAVAGVDLNPFAVEIARFRLLVAALKASGETRLAAAPDFRFQLATGDSLLHGRHFFRNELGGREDGFRRVPRHHYAAEDIAELHTILSRQYHAVVGNPPYITPKDAAMREAYREIYHSCHRTYGLGAPFTERFFDLAQEGTRDRAAGFVGLIVANSFMKREFGKKLIEDVLPKLDLTHVVDCSGAYIPGHGTPTAILFGRNCAPVASVVRTVRGIRGEPVAPEHPAQGLVWSAILMQTDAVQSESEFISTEDTPRDVLARHPWSLAGGGASEVQAAIEEAAHTVLGEQITSVGFYQDTHADEAFVHPTRFFERNSSSKYSKLHIRSENIRDWAALPDEHILFPFDEGFRSWVQAPWDPSLAWFWSLRTNLRNRRTFTGETYYETGRPWYDYHQFPRERAQHDIYITFAFFGTHNHFIVHNGGVVFNRSAPVINLPSGNSKDQHIELVGILNSSTACFWLKQVCHDKGNGGIRGGIAAEPWEKFREITGAILHKFPLPAERPLDFARALDFEAQQLKQHLPAILSLREIPTRKALDIARSEAEVIHNRMIALQEELDWRCYSLYGFLSDMLEYPNPPPLRLGERAFEIVMARRMAAGELETVWFERHRSMPITELPAHWPADYRAVVQRRIGLIESDPAIGLIEQPEYKRRWSAPTWEDMERDALRAWLLDRLEEVRFWPAHDPHVLSARALADAARPDPDFLSVAEIYVGRAGFDLEALVAELVTAESVPFLAALRYTDSGLRKRADWEATWDKQRAEDAIDAEVVAHRDEFVRSAWARMNPRDEGEVAEVYAARMAAGLGAEDAQKAADALIAAEAKRRKQTEVGDIPVPPKYKTADFQSQVFWRLRGGHDLPQERFFSFPHCARDADPSLPVLWAGHNHLAHARAIAGWYVERRETDGWPAERLMPLLAGLLELVPWLRQWHNDIDPETGLRMGDYFLGYVEEQARELGLTLDDLRAWTPPAPARRGRGRRTAA
ncbi:BREX-2 system adenine-specific DNA-methyltransferase PglX [Bradyrhizobium sp. Ash2021]|uniref:BREX-2 system adenine-specific DNA-methyltransferase PglX n=1 Tax=Bradyrhizobium sp. Ash2021 TaxID=2954771 RepID=UPI0028151979|nr:BREX-2 system adenine-specific DNA-methyltransferase PglX [Bradyrhizobium sp. Ash2021]WMT76288.1 BREX-2 system adenine-specific DNA-methyltransferase PglX [Bradyrhizobium sp. Ash2021]